MKNFLLSLFSFTIFSPLLAQVANGDFESWAKLILFEHPVTGISTSSSNYDTFFQDGSLNVTSVQGEFTRAMRIENAVHQGEVSPGYFLFGGVPTNDGENLVFENGFPMSDANVAGIRMDMRFNFPEQSTGFVSVQFKANGVPVGNGNFGTGTFVFPLSGSQDWNNILFTFDEGIGANPDECVIGIGSADLLTNDAPFTEGSFVEIDNVAFADSEVTIAGGNFESWSYVESVFYPQHCAVEITGVENQFFRSSDSFDGDLALGLITEERDGGIQTATCTMGLVENDVITPNIALASNHSNISFKYKYFSVNGDNALATIRFFAEDQGEFLEVFTKDFELMDAPAYEALDYDFVADFALMILPPTHVSLSFESGNAENPQVGSLLLVDNVELSGVLDTRSFNNPNLRQVVVYPNPTLARVEIDFRTTRTGYYRVYNPAGIQIAIRNFTSTRKLVHDLSGQPAGKYVFRFYHNGGVETVRVMKL